MVSILPKLHPFPRFHRTRNILPFLMGFSVVFPFFNNLKTQFPKKTLDLMLVVIKSFLFLFQKNTLRNCAKMAEINSRG